MKRYLLWLIVILSFFSSISACKDQAKLKGKKIVMIIANRQFQETEFKEPKEIFKREGADITIASSSLSTASGGNLRVKPDVLIDNIDVSNFNAVVFIGGFGVTEYFNNPKAIRIAREALEKGKILAAICMAPRILADADLIKGKKVTSYPSVQRDLKAKGADVTGAMVERDGNIITGNGPGAAMRFGESIVSALTE